MLLHRARNPGLWSALGRPSGNLTLDRDDPIGSRIGGAHSVVIVGGDVAPIDLVNGQQGVVSSSHMGTGATPLGPATTSDGQIYGGLSFAGHTTSPATLTLAALVTYTTPPSYPAIMTTSSAHSGVGVLGNYTGNSIPSFYRAAVAFDTPSGWAAFVPGASYFIAISWNGSIINGAYRRLDIPSLSTAVGASSGGANAGNGVFQFFGGCGNGSGGTWEGWINFGVISAGSFFTTPELVAWSEMPWKFLKPKMRRLSSRGPSSSAYVASMGFFF